MLKFSFFKCVPTYTVTIMPTIYKNNKLAIAPRTQQKEQIKMANDYFSFPNAKYKIEITFGALA